MKSTTLEIIAQISQILRNLKGIKINNNNNNIFVWGYFTKTNNILIMTVAD